MDKPDVLPQVYWRPMLRLMGHGIYVYGMSSLSQLSCQFPDVDVHTAGIPDSQHAQRTAVNADYGYVKSFYHTSVPMPHNLMSTCIAAAPVRRGDFCRLLRLSGSQNVFCSSR